VVRETNDLNQFATQINQANQTLDTKCQIAVADCGYASTKQLEKIDNQGIKVIVPSQRQALRKKPSSFAKEHFTYQDDYYLCPKGHRLTPYRLNKNNNKVYKISDKKICLACRHYGVCTTSPTGRTISRLLPSDILNII
jgi:transposase